MFATLLVLVVVLETSGLARAFGPDEIVHCCCGDHSSARPCACPDCPATLRRQRPHDLGPQALADADACHGHGAHDPGVLIVLATLPSPPSLPSPSAFATPALPSPSSLPSRAADVARPPP